MTSHASSLYSTDVVLVPVFGHVKIETRMRPEGNRIIGEGRSLHYDGDGRFIKATEWETNCVMHWLEPEPCRWWEFWK